MLYELLYPLRDHIGPLNVFRYISVRAVGAAVTALLVSFVFGPMIIDRLRHLALHQVVREGTPDSHAGKGTTPTMGGLIILTATLIPTLLWMRLNNTYVWIALIVTLWMGGIGFLDDYLKLRQKREGKENTGLVERWKLAGQITIGLLLGLYLWQFPISSLPGASTTLPFYKYLLIVPTFGMIKHQKTMGSSFITLSEGTIQVLHTTDANVTELSFVEHLDAVSAGVADVLKGVQHNYDSIVAVSHGNPVPACP